MHRFTNRYKLQIVKRAYNSIDAYLQGTETTQQELADKLGISQGALSMIKAGQRIPRPKLALRIHALTGIPLATLLAGTSGAGATS